jgi:hypothetical protein
VTVPATGLFVASCSREAALWAVKAHHYSLALPAARMQTIGCWEDGRFVGAVVFSRGACKDLAARFGFDQTEAVELTRVALGPHRTPTTRIVAIALRQVKAANPGLQVVISFSDPAQSHNGRAHTGTLYRAGGWWFLGMTHAEAMLRLGGVLRHRRTIISKFRTGAVLWLRQNVDAEAERVITPPKYRFAMPLTDVARERLRPHVQSYPRSREQSAESGTPDSLRKGRIDATCSLQVQEAACRTF